MGVSYNEKEQSFMFDFGHDGIRILSVSLAMDIR